jgi:DNA-binding GntR family transcriptional regulator
MLTFAGGMAYQRPMPPEIRTRNEAIFSQIREDILSGELAPGSRLRFAEMCSRYNTSVGVVREALTRIAEQGLARSEPQLGFSVVPVSVRDLRELTDLRCDIEGLTLRYAVLGGDLAWEGNIVAAHHRLTRTPARSADGSGRLSNEWSIAHNQFHNALLDGCPNRRLKSIALSLRDSAEVYRRAAQRRPVAQADQRDVAAEHRELLEAAVNRDAEAAVGALQRHIRATTTYLIEHNSPAFEQGEDEREVRSSA